MTELSDFYVYVIYRPNMEPCYVGKGRGRRMNHHLRFTHNKHLRSIFAQAGGKLPIFKVLDNASEELAFAFERNLIALIGREDQGRGPLVNFTDGGEGCYGHIKTPETRIKLSRSLKGIHRTSEWLENMSKSRKGKKRSPESCAKQSATMTGMKRGPSPLRNRPAPWVRERQLGTKNPEQSARMMGNKYSLGKNSTITREVAEQTRRMLKDGGKTHQQIAEFLSISLGNVVSIAVGRAWKELGPPIMKRGRYKKTYCTNSTASK